MRSSIILVVRKEMQTPSRQYSPVFLRKSSGTPLPKMLRTTDNCQKAEGELVGAEQHAIAAFPFNSREEL